MTEVKFMYNGIKVGGELYKAHYAQGNYTNFPQGTITIYAREYRHFPRIVGLFIENNSDMMIDYFVKDRVRVMPNNKYFPAVLAAYEKQQARCDRARLRREAI